MLDCDTLLKGVYSFENNYTNSFVEEESLVDLFQSNIEFYLNEKVQIIKGDYSIIEKNDSFKLIKPYREKTNVKIKQDYICNSQDWTGYVMSIEDETFDAKLIDNNDQTTYEIAQFDINEVSKSDLEYLKEGAVFYWSVGFANKNGQIIKQSFLRFKRSIEITLDEFDSIVDKAKELENSIIWE